MEFESESDEDYGMAQSEAMVEWHTVRVRVLVRIHDKHAA